MSVQFPATKHRRGKALRSNEKEEVRKVFESLKVANPLISIKDIASATANYLGVSATIVFNVIKQVRAEGRCSSPKRTRVRYKKYDNVDEATKEAIRRKVEMLRKEKKTPTIGRVLKLVNEDDALPNFAKTSFYRILKEMGLVCSRKPDTEARRSPSLEEPSSSGLQSSADHDVARIEQIFVDCEGVQLPSPEMQPTALHEASSQSRPSSTQVEMSSGIQEVVDIKQEPVENMEMESVVLEGSTADDVNPLTFEHVSLGEPDVKLEFSVSDEETPSPVSRDKISAMDSAAVHSKEPSACSKNPVALPPLVYYSSPPAISAGAHVEGGATVLSQARPEERATLASQFHRKTWIICSPVITSEEARGNISEQAACSPQPQAANGGEVADASEVDCERAVGSRTFDDEFDSFGRVVAAKLRHMTASQRLIAEKLVHDVLFHGQLGTLVPHTTLVPLLGS